MQNIRKVQLVIETTTGKIFESAIQEMPQETIENFQASFRKIKEISYFKIISNGIEYYFHPDKIVAIGIKIIE